MSDKMREEFEIAVKRDWPSAPLLRVNQVGAPFDGFYRDDRIQHAWWGWQASRAALVIELPEHYQYDSPGEVIPVLKDCRAAIEAAGVKVAP